MQTIIISKGSPSLREKKLIEIVNQLLHSNYDYLYEGHNIHICKVDDGKSYISIDQVRNLIKNVSLKPVQSNYKIVVIEESHMLTSESQNALLKILEEPPDYAQIFLSVDHPDNLLRTIRSRCKIIEVGGDHSGVLEGFSSSIDQEKVSKEFAKLLSLDIGGRIDWITNNKTRLKDRGYVGNLLGIWETVLRDVMICAKSSTNSGTKMHEMILNVNIKEDIKNLANKFEQNTWLGQLKYLQKVKRGILRKNANITLGIESFLVNAPV